MVAGITDHIWTTTELLSYRVPARFLDQLSEIEHLFPALDSDVHQGNRGTLPNFMCQANLNQAKHYISVVFINKLNKEGFGSMLGYE